MLIRQDIRRDLSSSPHAVRTASRDRLPRVAQEPDRMSRAESSPRRSALNHEAPTSRIYSCNCMLLLISLCLRHFRLLFSLHSGDFTYSTFDKTCTKTISGRDLAFHVNATALKRLRFYSNAPFRVSRAADFPWLDLRNGLMIDHFLPGVLILRNKIFYLTL